MSNYTETQYRDDIDDLAMEFIAHDGEQDYDLAESVDQTRWIIYNAGNKAVLDYTENENAIFEELGSDASDCFGGATCFQQVIQWAASWSMQADVRDRAERLKKEFAL